ncbi:transposase [Streptomyces osmaniensis]|uniref:transposase n=1 Tax=Streptomyces osmaniensis TaxID=593134 RepID=UPI003D155CE7
MATAYLLGVSTCQVEKLAESLGVTQLSKSQVSAMAKHLDEQVAAFRNRPLDAGPYAFVRVDALAQKTREGGRIINAHALIAAGANVRRTPRDPRHRRRHRRGRRRLARLPVLADRPRSDGVQLVISDAHAGLVDAIGAVLPGASWQRSRTHYARNLLCQVPKSAQPWVATLLRTLFEQPDTDALQAKMRHVLDALEPPPDRFRNRRDRPAHRTHRIASKKRSPSGRQYTTPAGVTAPRSRPPPCGYSCDRPTATTTACQPHDIKPTRSVTGRSSAAVAAAPPVTTSVYTRNETPSSAGSTS